MSALVLALSFLFIFSELNSSVSAVCTGSVFAIGNVQKLSGEQNKWSIYDNSCKEVDNLTTTENPCTTGKFSCSPDPIFFKAYHADNGTSYECSRNANAASERCGGGDEISVCCNPPGTVSTSSTSSLTQQITTRTTLPAQSTSTSTGQASTNSDSQDLSPGAKAGIALASIIVGLALLIILYTFCHGRRGRSNRNGSYSQANIPWPPNQADFHPQTQTYPAMSETSYNSSYHLTSTLEAGHAEPLPPAYSESAGTGTFSSHGLGPSAEIARWQASQMRATKGGGGIH